MQTTNYLLPQTLISSNGWTTPQNILLDDGSYAISNATSTLTSELVVGNFLFNLPTNSIVSGIEIEIKGKRGPLTNPASTLQIYAYDNTNNNNALYQYTPVFSNIDTVDGVYTLGSNIYTFGQTLTAEQMNNLKFKLIANSEMYVDSFKVRVFYGEPSTGTLPVIDGACQTIIQAQKFSLVDNVSSTDTTILVSKFETPDGVLITNTDIDPTQAAAGKGIPITVSHATRREENMYVTSIEHLTNGYTRLTVTRGWSFKQPIGQLVSRNKAHPVGNEVIISNSTPFYDELLRKCDIGTLVSAPIKVEDESVNITNYLRSLNFIGAGVTAVSTPAITGGGHDVDVTITGYGNQPINITNVTNITSGGNQVTTLSTNITTEGTDTALVVALSLEAGKTVTGVTYNSLPLLFGGAQNQNDVRVEVWYMANPSGGNHTITATFSSATYSCFEAASLSGVDQTTPFVSLIGNSGNSLLSTGSVTTLTPNSTFFHALATREVGMTYTAALGETLNSTSLSGAVQGGLASKLVGTPSTQNSQINLSILNDWANLLFAIQPTPVLPPIITPGQVSIQFQDENINLGTSGTVDTVDFTGSGVTATRTGNTVTVNVPGGGGSDEQVKVSATDTTTGYLDNKIELVSGTNTTVTKTILNPGANEKIQYQVNSTGGSGNNSLTIPGNEYYIGNDEPGFIVSFDKYIVNSSSQIEAYYIDSNGSYNRVIIPSSTPPIGWSTATTLAPTVSEDGQFLYITKGYTVSFGVFGLTVDKLDVNMNIVSTYTSTTYSPTIVSIQPMTFVKGNNIIICANATQPYSVGNPIYAEEFLMSGSTLTQTGITNIQYGVFGGGFFNFPRNGFTAIDGFTYLQYEFSGAEQVFKNTYSSLTLTNIGTSVFNTNNTGIETVYSWYTGSKTYFGFTVDGTNIGWFRKTFTLDQMSSPPFTQFFIWKYIYQLYQF